MYGQARQLTIPEPGNQVAINLDHSQCIKCVKQWQGQCTKPRANFNHCIVALKPHRLNDAIDNAGIVKKILAKALARAMHIAIACHQETSCCASVIAEAMLPVSIAPVPALSRAVP